jgi:hypothetical protein
VRRKDILVGEEFRGVVVFVSAQYNDYVRTMWKYVNVCSLKDVQCVLG